MSDEKDPVEEPDDQSLDEALSRGGLEQLPPNQPGGFLGEKGLDLYKADSFRPTLNAGVSQENDLPVVWMGFILAYLLFFPLAFWLLWRSPLFSKKSKIIVTVLAGAGIVAVGVALHMR